MLARLKNWAESFMSLSLGLRILFGTALGALGSSALLGFLAELGAVNYALAYGARLPTEGVPYLRYATTAISLAIFMIAFGVLFVLNYVLVGSLRIFLTSSSIQPLAATGKLTDIPLGRYLLLGVIPAIAATQLLFQLFLLTVPLNKQTDWLAPIFVLVATGLILLLGRKPHWTKWVIGSVFVILIVGFLIVVFTPSLYGKALRFARQGGGVDVVLEMNCQAKTPCVAEIRSPLFLRTTESFLLRNAATQEIREIPGRSVEAIRYVGEERWGTR